jgi:hypothetical protein
MELRAVVLSRYVQGGRMRQHVGVLGAEDSHIMRRRPAPRSRRPDRYASGPGPQESGREAQIRGSRQSVMPPRSGSTAGRSRRTRRRNPANPTAAGCFQSTAIAPHLLALSSTAASRAPAVGRKGLEARSRCGASWRRPGSGDGRSRRPEIAARGAGVRVPESTSRDFGAGRAHLSVGGRRSASLKPWAAVTQGRPVGWLCVVAGYVQSALTSGGRPSMPARSSVYASATSEGRLVAIRRGYSGGSTQPRESLATWIH